jgi:hypothetical protein
VKPIASLFLLLTFSAVAAADTVPPPGSYAFNWLDPEGAECSALTEADLAKVTSCEASDNAFGLSLESHACKVDENTELMVYATADQCQEALETMQANGP